LDGAHNPQKMKIFIESLKKVYPNQKFSFLIAIKNGKDYGMMLNFAIPEAKNIILSTFKITGQDMFHNYEDPKNIGKYLQKNNFLDYEIIPDAKMAFEKLIRNPAHFLIVTGSIYFLNIIYRLLSQRKRNKSNLH
jgi:folylpolyglutamate synthase/dihydropteroate synthase